MRLAVAFLLLATPALAQPAPPHMTVEQRIAAEIGQCSIQRASLATENEILKERVQALTKQVAEMQAKEPKP